METDQSFNQRNNGSHLHGNVSIIYVLSIITILYMIYFYRCWTKLNWVELKIWIDAHSFVLLAVFLLPWPEGGSKSSNQQTIKENHWAVTIK